MNGSEPSELAGEASEEEVGDEDAPAAPCIQSRQLRYPMTYLFHSREEEKEKKA